MINTIRHADVFDPNVYKDKKIVIVGAGAVGSRVFENLISTGLTNITLIDFDIVESHNLANQLFIRDDIGRAKVAACRIFATSKAGQDAADKMTFINGKAEADCLGWFEEAEVVISCVDTFAARAQIFALCKASWANLFVEASMATDHFNVFMVNPDDEKGGKWWLDTLGNDSDPAYETSACGGSLSVGEVAMMCGAVMSQQVKTWLHSGYMKPSLRIGVAPFVASDTNMR